MSDKPYVPFNPDVAEHIANGNWNLARSQGWGETPNNKQLYATLATAEFAAATAKATAMAVFDTDVNAAVEDVMRERAERQRAAREKMGR
jgi:hypothetical protein